MTSDATDPTGTVVDAPAPAWRRRVVWALLALVVLWLVLATVTTVRAHDELTRARGQLRQAERAARRLDPPAAVDHLLRAQRSLRTADDRLSGRVMTPAGWVPGLARNVRAVRVVTRSALDVAQGGVELLSQVGDVTDGAGEAPSASVTAAVPVDAIASLGQPIGELATLADRVAVDLRAVDSPALVGPVAEAVLELEAESRDLASLARRGVEAVDLAATVLGADGTTRLFVGAATPAELRGTGGLVGAWSIVEIVDGRMSFRPFRPIRDIVVAEGAPAVAPSAEYVDRYGPYDALADPRNSTMTPDVPTAATVLEGIWAGFEPQTPIDGVLLVDPFALAEMVRGSGGVRLPIGGRVPADQVVDWMTNRSYVEIADDEQRKEMQGEIATAALGRLVERLGAGEVAGTLQVLESVFSGGHARLHLADPRLQAAVADVGLDGGMHPGTGDSIGVTLNNGAGNKTDHWLEQTVRIQVAPLAGGGSDTTLALGLRNGAPSAGYSQEVLGPFLETLGPGDVRHLVGAFCAPGCAFTDAPRGARVGTELDFGVADVWRRIDAGEEASLEWAWRRTGSWSSVGGVYRHEVVVDVPYTVLAPDVEVTVLVPRGVAPQDLPDTATFADGHVTWRPGGGRSVLVVQDGTPAPAPRPGLGEVLRRPAGTLF